MDLIPNWRIDNQRRRQLAAFAIANSAVREALTSTVKNPAHWRVQTIVRAIRTLNAFPYIPGLPLFWAERPIKIGALPKAGAVIDGLEWIPTIKAVKHTDRSNWKIGGRIVDLYREEWLPAVGQRNTNLREIRKAVAVLTRGNAYGFVLDEAQNEVLDEMLYAILAMEANGTYPIFKLKEKEYDLCKQDRHGRANPAHG